MKTLYPLLFTLALLVSACSAFDSKPDEGKVTDKTYQSDLIGWTYEIPEGYEAVNQLTVAQENQRGIDALEETVGQEIPTEDIKYLLNYRKGQFSGIQVSAQPFEEDYPGEWEESWKLVKEIIAVTFQNQGIPVDTASTELKVDGKVFQAFHTSIIGPNGQVILKQDMFGALINGQDFVVNLNYQNPEDQEILRNSFFESKFKN